MEIGYQARQSEVLRNAKAVDVRLCLSQKGSVAEHDETTIWPPIQDTACRIDP
jgi:hypothetical protein